MINCVGGPVTKATDVFAPNAPYPAVIWAVPTLLPVVNRTMALPWLSVTAAAGITPSVAAKDTERPARGLACASWSCAVIDVVPAPSATSCGLPAVSWSTAGGPRGKCDVGLASHIPTMEPHLTCTCCGAGRNYHHGLARSVGALCARRHRHHLAAKRDVYIRQHVATTVSDLNLQLCLALPVSRQCQVGRDRLQRLRRTRSRFRYIEGGQYVAPFTAKTASSKSHCCQN